MPMSLPPVDPDAMLLCQLPGMRVALLRRLIERWETAAGILRAPSADLRAQGVPPAMVARIVAAPRQRSATAASLKSLERMGIVPLPLLDPDYPRRLRESPDPPLLLHLQGRWPPRAPAVTLTTAIEFDETGRQDVAALLAALGALGITTITGASNLDLLPETGVVGVLPYGLLLARSRVPDTLRRRVGSGEATLLSVAPVNAPATPALEQTADAALLALADGLIVVGDPPDMRWRPDLHRWSLDATGNIETDPGLKRIRGGETGAQSIARALGIRTLGTATVQQERLW